MTVRPLAPCPKAYRAVDPRATTLRLAEAAVPATGITRVADITGLDRIGIPVFSCIRPTAADGAISIYNGKGATPLAAGSRPSWRESSVLRQRSTTASHTARLLGAGAALDPTDLVLPDGADPTELPLGRGARPGDGERCSCPPTRSSTPAAGVAAALPTSTNGIASGNTLEEAVFHALGEVIERDAWSLVEATRTPGRPSSIPSTRRSAPSSTGSGPRTCPCCCAISRATSGCPR